MASGYREVALGASELAQKMGLEGTELMTAKGSPLKIYVPETSSQLRPDASPFRYPTYATDWGIEQDFLRFLLRHYPHRVESPDDADFVYLPVFWTRYHLSHNFGRLGLVELADELEPALSMPGRKFTVCQYDDGPLVDLGDAITYLGSRKTAGGRDAPLLSSRIPRPWTSPSQRYRASFVGRVHTHPVREELRRQLSDRGDVLFGDSLISPRRYSKSILSSKIALSPRGYGGSSFRFYEAMQLGVVPWLISDFDTRPFKALLDWDSFSFYSPSVDHFLEHFDAVDSFDLEEKGTKLREASKLVRLGRWPTLLLEDLKLGRSYS